ncbi:MAG: hypothetical protein RL141_186 [Candidatus Parcubacteria bacterium]|jgi:diacylglycerol kinase
MPKMLRGIIRSFSAASRGVGLAFREERTFRVMVAAALLVVALVATLPLQTGERLLLLLLTGSILVLELINSMVERLADLLKPRLSVYVGDVKDLMAGAVLLASVVAAVIAAMVLLPRLASFLSSPHPLP